MEESKQNTGGKVSMHDEDVVDEFKALQELEKMKRFLEAENGRLKTQIDMFTLELDGINIAVSSAKEYRDSYEARRKNAFESMEKLESKKDDLMKQINESHLKIKAAKEDEEAVSKLTDALQEELNDVKMQKSTVLKRLNDVRVGIKTITNDKDLRMPHLKGYHSVLKQLYTAFKETQNRMDVSLLMRQK